MVPIQTHHHSRELAVTARQCFVQSLCESLSGIDKSLYGALTELVSEVATHQVMQRRRDTWLHYRTYRQAWIDGVTKAWRSSEAAALRGDAARPSRLADAELDGLQLVSEEAVENRLLGARLARAITAKANNTLEAVRQRTKYLQGQELEADDILLPEVACLALVDQWFEAGLTRDELDLVFDKLEGVLIAAIVPAFEEVGRLYDDHQVPDLAALRTRVVRPSGGGQRGLAGAALGTQQQAASGYGALTSGLQGMHGGPGMYMPSAVAQGVGGGAVDSAPSQAYGWSQLDMTRQRAEDRKSVV